MNLRSIMTGGARAIFKHALERIIPAFRFFKPDAGFFCLLYIIIPLDSMITDMEVERVCRKYGYAAPAEGWGGR